MASLNQCSFIGNLGADPEIKATADGKKLAKFRVACTETWKSADGERKERTEWISIVVFNEGLAGVCESYLHKGSKVFVQGAMQTRRWQDQSGQDRYSTEVVLQRYRGVLTMLSARDSAAEPERREEPAERSAPATSALPDDLDEPIPF